MTGVSERSQQRGSLKDEVYNFIYLDFIYWSGKRDSNSRPQPWQGCALPTELFPRR
ncbi:hypothetical protein XNC3_150005 [Xenorhabdus nematophila F1]|nr:hypothetical protein XNC3_150005 [Xenorhabdus nematophila F1]CEK21430.1 protein of unknown function [Xenorhabdus nematophila AN6/1]